MKEYSDFWPKVTGETKRKRRELVAARLREPLSPWNGESRLFSRKELVKRGSSWVACALKRSEEGELLGVELELGLSHRTWEQAQQLADMFEIEPEGRLILLPEMELSGKSGKELAAQLRALKISHTRVYGFHWSDRDDGTAVAGYHQISGDYYGLIVEGVELGEFPVVSCNYVIRSRRGITGLRLGLSFARSSS